MKHGLSEAQLEEIIDFIKQYPEVDVAVLFGSRAIGTFKEASDVDIALKGEKVTHSLAAKMKFNIEEDTFLPFFFDFIAFPTITNEKLKEHIERKGVVIYRRGESEGCEWKEYKLGECIELIGGGTPKTAIPEYWNGNIPWLSVIDFNTGNKYVYRTEKTITKLGLENSSTKILDQNDIIISARGTVGAIAVLRKQMAFNQSCYGVKNLKGRTEQDYLYYLIKDSIDGFKQIAPGGVFDTITRETFDAIDILLPPLPEQRAIASVLSSLDDKIDLLHRQNKTLEAMAEALFRQWFVVEANENWEEDSILSMIELVGGGTPKTSIADYWDGNIPWLSGGDIASNHKSFVLLSDKNITEQGLNNSSAKLLPEFATVISARGTVGKFCLLAKPMTYSQSNYGILPRIKNCFFYTYLLINHVVEELQSSAYGNIFDTITTNTFRDLKCSIPPETLIKKFETEVTDYFKKIRLNKEQIHTLEKIRDTLLPKLMSGEMRISHQKESA